MNMDLLVHLCRINQELLYPAVDTTYTLCAVTLANTGDIFIL